MTVRRKMTSDQKYLDLLKDLVLSQVDTDKVKVFLFGSRALPNYPSRADADIGLDADEPIPSEVYHKIRNAVEDSMIPWDVDIVDFTRVDPQFRKEATRHIVVWNEPVGRS